MEGPMGKGPFTKAWQSIQRAAEKKISLSLRQLHLFFLLQVALSVIRLEQLILQQDILQQIFLIQLKVSFPLSLYPRSSQATSGIQAASPPARSSSSSAWGIWWQAWKTSTSLQDE